MNQRPYPQLLDRIKATFADFFIIMIFMILGTNLITSFADSSEMVKQFLLVGIFLLYFPVFVSTFGGTLGHQIMGLRVKQEKNPEKNILFHLAIIRILAKVTLGWISLLTVTGSEKKTAIHDSMVGSVVLYK